MILAIILTAMALQVEPLDPALESGEARYRSCARLVASAPEQAAQDAREWLVQNGGLKAHQCLGLALAAMERWADSAASFETAARLAPESDEGLAADLWAQAGNAWIASGESGPALSAFDRALASPGLADELRGEVHLDRGRVLVATGDSITARREIDLGLQLVPSDPFAWYLSAALARREDDLARALGDIGRARALAPTDPDILLLAGTLAGLSGDMVEAERLYRETFRVAPESEAGRKANSSLQTLSERAPTDPGPERDPG